MGKNKLQVAILNAILLMGGTLVYPVTAHAQDQALAYRIDAGDLENALSSFGTQSRIQLIYPPELLKGKRSGGLTGNHPPMEALRQLLQGSGLEAERVNDRTVVIKRATPAPANNPQAGTRNATAVTEQSEPEVKDLGNITVTGTRIRGGTTPSPVITIGSERIREEGFTDLGEVVRSIPQNYSGGQNPGIAIGGSQGGMINQNDTGGSALNLRGLGPDATLTLLNGRRFAYSGNLQAVDISAIPVEAVERIEIVPDGASAIYGSDAVGGVANVILSRDYDGLMVGARYGTATDGGLTTREYTATAGTIWSSGGLIATYKNVSVDPIYSDDRDYTDHMFAPTTIYPGSDLKSGLLSIHQSIGEDIELRLDALRTERDQKRFSGRVDRYLSYYPSTTTSMISPSVEFSLPRDWSLTIGGSHGKDEYVENTRTHFLDSRPSTLTSDACYCNESQSYEVGTEGPLFALGGGDARLAVGAGYRTDDFLSISYVLNTRYADGDESSRYGYAELNLPLIGVDQNITGARRLALIAAVRSEDYDSFGRVTTPKLGVLYDPSADFTLKASWGKSFKAPTLLHRYQTKSSYLYTASTAGGSGYAPDATVLMSYGGNADLEPERARTWSASVAFHPQAVPGLEAELTWFDIDYTDRVVVPISNVAQALINPNYAEFLQLSPTAEAQAALLAVYTAFYNFSGVPYDPTKVVAIIRDEYINVARQRIKGLDLSGSYKFDLGESRMTIRGSASFLDSSQQTSRAQTPYDIAGTIFNPAEYSGRIGAVWTRGGFSTSSFINYTSGVTSRLTTSTEETASFTTLDAVVRYDTGDGNGFLSGLVFALSAQNLLDKSPPLYTVTSANHVPYDSTNYSAIGRYLSFSISKRF